VLFVLDIRGEFALHVFPEGKRFKKGGNTEKFPGPFALRKKEGKAKEKTSFALQGLKRQINMEKA